MEIWIFKRALKRFLLLALKRSNNSLEVSLLFSQSRKKKGSARACLKNIFLNIYIRNGRGGPA